MNAPAPSRIELQLERAAAALFGAAVGYATFLLVGGEVRPALAYACAAGLAAFLLSAFALQRVPGRGEGFQLATFAPRELEFSELEELMLTEADRTPANRTVLVLSEADRLRPEELLLTEGDRLRASTPDLEPLLLDDILTEMDPDSRVVRLFDRSAMPTPGQMKSRIDGHLQRGAGAAVLPDASQALSEALAQLRRSLA